MSWECGSVQIKLTEYAEALLEEFWQPRDLNDAVRRHLYALWVDETKRGRRWMPGRAEYAIKRATNLARRLAEMQNKPVWDYLWMALEKQWIENWYLSMGV